MRRTRATIYMLNVTHRQAFAVLDGFTMVGEDPDPDPGGPDPDPGVPFDMPKLPEPTPSPTPDCQPMPCIHFGSDMPDGDFFWPGAKKRPRPGDPPPWLSIVRHPDGQTTIFAGDKAIIATRIVVVAPAYRQAFDKDRAPGIVLPLPDPLPSSGPRPVRKGNPVCINAICIDALQIKDPGTSVGSVRNFVCGRDLVFTIKTRGRVGAVGNRGLGGFPRAGGRGLGVHGPGSVHARVHSTTRRS